MTFFLMHLLKSALGGMTVMIGYYFLCVNHALPQKFSIIVLGILPENYRINWYITQIIFIVFFFNRSIFDGEEQVCSVLK